MSTQACYPVFTNSHTSSIGIDECQMLLLKTALLLGVEFKLGVGYETAVVDIDPECRSTNQRPSWLVTYNADDKAVQRYGLDSTGGQERFDALFGCDGGNSRVRKTQVEWLGEPQTRVYKRMFGIVSNLRKCSRSKLKALGFERGLEPEDRAGIQTGVYFYKASFHNYLIVHPSKEEMDANGIPWKAIYSFDKGRQNSRTEQGEEQEQLKATLKKYMTRKAKQLGIPIDKEGPNDGFVDAPNDVMAFDFSQFYNCEKSAAAYVPPLSWNRAKDGEWEIFCPLVALAGDAVTDPNWLLGVGLQRGWNSAMDSVFYADNLYNNISFNGRPPSKTDPMLEPTVWSNHLDNLMSLMQLLGNAAREGSLSNEMDVGTFDERGPVVVQIKRELMARKIEPPVPAYVPNVDPWSRYQCFALELAKNYKGKLLWENKHPLATRELALFFENQRFVERAGRIRDSVTRPKSAMLTWPKRFECSAFWAMMPLVEIDGKLAPGADAGSKHLPGAGGISANDLIHIEANSKGIDGSSAVSHAASESSSRCSNGPNPDEVKVLAKMKSSRLHERIVTVAMNGPTIHHHSSADETLGNIIFKKNGTPSAEMSQENPMKHHLESNPISQFLLAGDTPNPKLVDRDEIADSGKAGLGTATATFGGDESSGTDRALLELRQTTMALEKKSLLAKLAFAQAEVTKVAYEQKALEAKMHHVETEVEMIRQCLQAYEDAEAKLTNYKQH